MLKVIKTRQDALGDQVWQYSVFEALGREIAGILQITLSYGTGGKQPTFVLAVCLAQLSAATVRVNLVTSHPEIPVLLYATPNDMHDSATTMFVTCKMASIKLSRNRSIRCKQSPVPKMCCSPLMSPTYYYAQTLPRGRN